MIMTDDQKSQHNDRRRCSQGKRGRFRARKALPQPEKMSLDELSRRSGVSKGMLVEIEGCRANPSIALLCRLASAMNVSVADFVNVAGKPAVHLIDSGAIPVLWKGEKGGSARLLAGTSGPDMVELWEWVLYPGETLNLPVIPRAPANCSMFQKGL